MTAPKIIISGSGIAGSVFAFWLLRAYKNAQITIVERAPSLRLTGASEDIRSSAGIQFIEKNGEPIATFFATGRTDYQSITSEFEIFRVALAKIFIKPILSRVKIIFDDTVESYTNHDDEVTVTFANNRDTQKYDLLVAADGLSSRVRGMMFGGDPRDHIHHEGVHIAYFTMKEDLLDEDRLAKWYNATKGRVIFLRPDPNPTGRTSALLMNVTTQSDFEAKLLKETYKDARWQAHKVLQSMRESDDFYCSLFGQASPKLCDGGVVLLGDAGYATPGIGTSVDITGCYVLAGGLLDHPDDYDAALKRYEQLMLPFVRSQQGDDTVMQMLNPQTSWGLGVRNAVLRLVTGTKLDRLVMATAAKLGFTDKKLTLPDYQWPDVPT
ncbi:MAG: hypothetical protein FE78DRAFT_75099 [Acidomyces sp. 'richmondensis']|nr:MAG: hypothetical protein FE78DRAFT_75099 [Acidomyces sp. 'richmondensis']